MHVLRFEKDDVKKTVDNVFRVSFVFQWVVGRDKYDGYPVEDEKLGKFFCRTRD
jgi:hypothetical protein